MKIKFYAAGGMIDKVYFDAKSEYQVGVPKVEEILQDSNVAFKYAVESVLRKDSLEMTDEDLTCSCKITPIGWRVFDCFDPHPITGQFRELKSRFFQLFVRYSI